MGRSYVRFLSFAFAGSLLAPLITLAASQFINDRAALRHSVPAYVGWAFVALLASLAATFLLFRLEDPLEQMAAAQRDFLDSFPDRYVSVAIFVAAALSLFLELSVVRWQATVFPFFALYKNLSMLSCFAGLGLGYAMGRKNTVPLFMTIPLFCWQFVLMMGVRYGLSDKQLESLFILPFREQLNMGLDNVFQYGLQTYFVLAIIFVLTALAFLPIGQLCGSLMERREKLTAYGLNLLGSLAGVLLIFLVSALWTPPSLWFVLSFAVLLLFFVRRKEILLVGGAFVLLALTVLDWPVKPWWQRIYSPYQLLEVGHSQNGLMVVRAAGHYYQRIHDLARPADPKTDHEGENARNYYELPYQFHRQIEDVAVVGAGTGNDVAAALRAGSQQVDAIEIDPAILMLGKSAHPEHPYDDPRVHGIVNDARSFLRSTNKRYDLIVFGLLDSHALLSQASSVRLDSFVYTVQAFREARARLRPHGMISLAFSVLNDRLGRKIYMMLQEAFDGRAPLCVGVGYDRGVVFLAADDEVTLPPDLLARTGFQNRTAVYSNSRLLADVSTDDWPFFYMPSRVYPVSYLGMVALVLALSGVLTKSFVKEKTQFGHFPFFLLGAGFMLVETKGITELGLTFGNSWQVIGIVIASILLMAYLANCVVQWLDVRRPAIPLILLLASLGIGWWLGKTGGFPPTFLGRFAAAAVLTCPLFFSGIVFSALLRLHGEITGIMATNIFGAMCGGLLEYNSMYFGFRFMYVIACGLYLLILIWVVFGLERRKVWAAAPGRAVRG